jgi:hypothetical protein
LPGTVRALIATLMPEATVRDEIEPSVPASS